MIGINVGSGQRPFDQKQGWHNVDAVVRPDMPRPDIVCDGANLPFNDGYADYVVLHHVLEHFGCGEGEKLIEEAYRVLRFGGSLLVFVPDLRRLANLWLSEGISTQIYATNLYGAYMGHEEDRHKWGYDKDSLREFLCKYPFETTWGWVEEFNWRTIPGADIARDDRWILGMEAYK